MPHQPLWNPLTAEVGLRDNLCTLNAVFLTHLLRIADSYLSESSNLAFLTNIIIMPTMFFTSTSEKYLISLPNGKFVRRVRTRSLV